MSDEHKLDGLHVVKSTHAGYNICDEHGNSALARVHYEGAVGVRYAHLFAAADDLLAACEKTGVLVSEVIGDRETFGETFGNLIAAVEILSAAIATARPEAR